MSVYPRNQRISNKKEFSIGLHRPGTQRTRREDKNFYGKATKAAKIRVKKIALCGLCDLAVKNHSLMPS